MVFLGAGVAVLTGLGAALELSDSTRLHKATRFLETVSVSVLLPPLPDASKTAPQHKPLYCHS